MSNLLSEGVSRDILMNVVLGNLAAEDVRFFVRTSGSPGLHLALLHEISTADNEYSGSKDLAARLKVSQGAIRERILRLLGSGFLSQFGGGVFVTRATLKGRVFLDFCGQIFGQVQAGQVSPEILQIMRLLNMRFAPSAFGISARSLHLAGPLLTEVPEMVTGRLVATISAAIEKWGISLDGIPHKIWDREGDTDMSGLAVADIVARLRQESQRYHVERD
ncbi:hypothetical protein [Frankia sp. R82]|uniref:hypothetical protein n=1 Tax=Frankia sp. R82 TaxID=2950553 RepID=UPI0020434786|nr:hypothetical protein [Frankia sp. R82]MCM3884790.1 hypothetical protein [Frankia sp. R82]